MNKSHRNILFVVFTLSGFSGLIYESIWTHYLKLFLGHAAYAQTLVLAIFMGGLTIGSWLCSRYSGKWDNLLRGYALAEGATGILALIFHLLFTQVVQLSYTSVIPRLGSTFAVNAFKWSLSAILILPQSILLGMTFPLLSSALIRAFPQTPGKSIAMLYFTNSIGAAVGVLISGFLLIRIAGLPGTIGLAGVINLGIAAFIWFLAKEDKAQSFHQTVFNTIADTAGGTGWYWFLLSASLATGTASFIYEIGWIRMLSLVLGSSTHAFELMLSAFIFGLAFGGLWVQRRIDSHANPVRFLVIVQIAMGLLAISTLPLYENTFSVMQWLLSKLPKTDAGYTLFNLSSNAIALAIMLPATFCAGMTLPLITYILIRHGHGEKSIGAVYAMNTVGAIIGVFFAIHLGMPVFGLKGLITIGAVMDMGLGLLLLWSIRVQHDNKRMLITAIVLCIFAVFASQLFVKLDPYKMASGVYREGALLKPEISKLIFHKDGKTATVSLNVVDDGSMSIRTNGKVDAKINIAPDKGAADDESTMIFVAALPLAYNPQARTAANIGMGSGLTTHTLLCNPRLTEVDTIEIEKEMVEAAKHFGSNVELAYKDPRSKIYIDDAKTFFSSSNKQYDIIISEPSNPWVSGVAGLFSTEFYRLIGRHLNKNGLFVQWFQLYEINMDLVASIFKAMSSNFNDFEVYAANYGDLLIIAKNSGPLGSMDPVIFSFPRLAGQLKRVQAESIQDLETRRIGNKKILAKFFETFPMPANSDYYPVLDQNAARTRFLGASAQDILKLGYEPLPVVEMLAGSDAKHSSTNVTFSSAYPKTKAVTTAMALRDYYLQGFFLPVYKDIVTAENRGYAEQLKSIFSDCGATLSNPNRRIFLFNVAKNMFPYLTPAESSAVWKKLESGFCVRNLTQTEKNYITLFKAIGSRDAKNIVASAQTILETEQDITRARLRYVMAAEMLGEVAQGNRTESAGLWSVYRNRAYGTDKSDFLFRFLNTEKGDKSDEVIP